MFDTSVLYCNIIKSIICIEMPKKKAGLSSKAFFQLRIELV